MKPSPAFSPASRVLARLAPSCLVAAACAVAALPGLSAAGGFSVLSYNVRGLPTTQIEDRTDAMKAIAPLLEDYHTPAEPFVGQSSVAALSGVFASDYFQILADGMVITYPYVSEQDLSGGDGLGDGLTVLSDFKAEEFTRNTWEACAKDEDVNEGDCSGNKGFTLARYLLEEGVSLDLYTLHADAGSSEESRTARRSNLSQLLEAIGKFSPPEHAVVVVGDTNARYTRVGPEGDNLQELLVGAELSDAWVQLRRSGIVPGAGDDIEADCKTDPASSECELDDKVLYRDGTLLVLAPQAYVVPAEMFSNEKGDGLSDHVPVSVSFDYATVTTTTTTTVSTSTSTSTSTTTLPARPCGDPQALVYQTGEAGEIGETGMAGEEGTAGDAGMAASAVLTGRAVAASDALFTLKAAVGSLACAPCTCDVNDSGSVTAADALRILKKAVGQAIDLICPPC